MDDILKTLFFALDEEENPPEVKAALAAAEPVMERAREKLSREEFDAFWSAVMHVGMADVENCFALGFRAGARVMLEVLHGA